MAGSHVTDFLNYIDPTRTYKTLRQVVPYEFFVEYMDMEAAKYLDMEITEVMDGTKVRWPGKHRHVYSWWKLINDKAVGLNENPGRGWSFPVITCKD